ncbi:hypothetical protein DRO44_01245, partial [Candidatus Bathyarchaeota archaeon]
MRYIYWLLVKLCIYAFDTEAFNFRINLIERKYSSYICLVRVAMGKYTLVVTEKPDAAQRIASALDSKG